MGSERNALACGNHIEDSIDFDFYKALFDPVRSEIIVFLASHGRKNISEIAEQFTQDRSVISRHLELLNRYGIVSKTKVNRYIFYELNSAFIISKFDETTQNLKRLIQMS
jgi:DNA-binding transcriptional ArsR family regulator